MPYIAAAIAALSEMSYTSYALIAVVAYAISNVVIDHQLKDLTPSVNVAIYAGGICLLSLITIFFQARSGKELVLPTPTQIRWLVFIVVCYFVADLCYYGSYHAGGTFSQITTIVAFVPMFALIINSVITLTLPGLNQVGAALLAAGAIYLATK